MVHIFVLEKLEDDSKLDNKLFSWAKKIEEQGYEVSQIWEEEFNYDDEYTKGINFKMKNAEDEGIYLMSDKKSLIWVEVDEGFLTKNGYIKFISNLVA